MPQWLWSPVLEGVTCAVNKASSLLEAAANISQMPPCFTSALLPSVRVVSSAPEHPLCILRLGLLYMLQGAS